MNHQRPKEMKIEKCCNPYIGDGTEEPGRRPEKSGGVVVEGCSVHSLQTKNGKKKSSFSPFRLSTSGKKKLID